MLGSLRKFSGSIYAKILLGIIVIPFVFWGMGDFTSGGKNVVVVIDKEKYSSQNFVDFIQRHAPRGEKISSNDVERFLPHFIGEILMEKEIESLGFKLSDKSLSELIKNQKEFKRDNKFSRTEYEKFLLQNSITATYFEENLSKGEKKRQLLDFVGGGIFPSKFLVNNSYDLINHKRKIELINLEGLFKNELNFSSDEIKSFYENNKDNFKQVYRTIKLLKINPKVLIGADNYNDVFFKKIDEIDDIIMQGENLDYIVSEFNLKKPDSFSLNELGEDTKSKIIESLPKKLIKIIFSLEETEPTALVESEDQYFVIEVTKIETIEKAIENESVQKKILSGLKFKKKREIVSEFISRINQNKFTKLDFDNLSKDKNLSIKNITLNSQSDSSILKENLVGQIYSYPEKRVFMAHDINLTENYLVYINKILHANIDVDSDEYKKYLNLSKTKITSRLFNTYDIYIKSKYKIDINKKALDAVKNYFN